MLRIYSWLSSRLTQAELRIEMKIKERLQSRKSGFFSRGLFLLDIELLLLELAENLARFIIIIFLDSGKGFNMVFGQQAMSKCRISYTDFKQARLRLRTFSYGTLATLIIAVGIVSLVMNLLFSEKLTGWAQTFNWTQTSWTTGASTTAVATHAANQTNWTRFSSSSANIATTSNGITLTASSVVAVNHTSDADFQTGTLPSNMYINGGSLKMTKPVGATCSSDTECPGSTSGNCQSGVCRPQWVTAAGVCSNISVLSKDRQGQWQTSGVSCSGPQCSGATLVNPQTNPAVDFSSYPAQNFCKAAGGRLPTVAELACIYSNQSSYNSYGSFTTNYYWTNVDYNGVSARIVFFLNGDQTSWNGKTDGTTRYRCIKP